MFSAVGLLTLTVRLGEPSIGEGDVLVWIQKFINWSFAGVALNFIVDGIVSAAVYATTPNDSRDSIRYDRRTTIGEGFVTTVGGSIGVICSLGLFYLGSLKGVSPAMAFGTYLAGTILFSEAVLLSVWAAREFARIPEPGAA
jgi:hypothetical protein